MPLSKFIHFIFTKSLFFFFFFLVSGLWGIDPCLHGAYILDEMNVKYYDS